MMANPWPADSSPRVPEPARVVELLDGSRLELTIVPAGGFVYEWPGDKAEEAPS